ncbi:hypothetical protein PVAND_012875 [Polypedilum vanderplanki]|uniref:Oligopeptide transporter 1 n=1 Tax=Polypedilum vanderplanki TaxID=319348 RepID=A0A9J6CMT9_POLVA|nr:hypothetical protein PVAND_012875 [Polypedilum vanderplanki]
MAASIKSKDDLIKRSTTDIESIQKKSKFPKSVFFIVANEFCERFNYYGIRAILSLYLTRKLLLSDDTATIIYHGFASLVYSFCVLGAIIADSFLGKFLTIVWLSIVYLIGNIIMTLGAVEPWKLPNLEFAMIGLVLIALGSGGIKPCVAAFGGEQFKLPQQAKQLAIFFSMFYFSINLGSFFSTIVTPILRENIVCFGMIDCYPLGFGLPAVLMSVAIIIFLIGKPMYKILPNQGNMFVKVCGCIANAISTRAKEKNTNPCEHWLDYAEAKYGRKLVMETKTLLKLLVLYIPLPLFWALYDQQGSRWTFQATRMDGDFGWITIQPDQMQVINPLLILIFIPLCEIFLYPILARFGIRRPLQKMTLGGILAGVAFLCSMVLEIHLEKTYPLLPSSGESQLRMFNGGPCAYEVTTNLEGNAAKFELPPNSYFSDLKIKVPEETRSFEYKLRTLNNPNCASSDGVGLLNSGKANSIFLNGKNYVNQYVDDTDKSNGLATIRILASLPATSNVVLMHSKKGIIYEEPASFHELKEIPVGNYKIMVDNKMIGEHKIQIGGVYSIVIYEVNQGKFSVNVFTITEPNSISILWLIPQYFCVTLAEVMFAVTGLEFSYTQAPESMKSVLQGCWQMTVGLGNLIVAIVVTTKMFESQAFEFLLFALMMFLDMAIFMVLGIYYKPIPLEELKKVENESNEKK